MDPHNLIQSVLELATQSQQLKSHYCIISKILLFPSIKNQIESLHKFENEGYLTFINNSPNEMTILAVIS